jgi:hypothetical protein
MCFYALGSWGGRCLSVAPYVTGIGSADGATAPLEGANVGYALSPASVRKVKEGVSCQENQRAGHGRSSPSFVA